ncbi:hypothetical protein [Clostridium tetani]|uniref:hypothetical protein n=1 Tax=Clostridium tetani TaxID=1513 RepID=UPI0034578782
MKLKAPTNSGDTVHKSALEDKGGSTFLAPLSKPTCRVLASSSTLLSTPKLSNLKTITIYNCTIIFIIQNTR